MPRRFLTVGLQVLVIAVGVITSLGSVADAREPKAAGLHDLVVFDPAAHQRGLPAVVLNRVNGGKVVDIPPAVHVHRFYYSGDKEYQGPIIKGGPTIVVANHPKTGQRMYVDVVLPAGAPRIAYSKNSITYVYTKQRVAVKFRNFPFDPNTAIVKNHSGQGWTRSAHDLHQRMHGNLRDKMKKSQLVQSVKDASGDTGRLLQGAHTALGNVTAGGVEGVKALSNFVPGVTYLRSLPEQRAEREYANEVRGAARKKVRRETPFARTNR